MSNPNFIQTPHFAPPGMIPEFNELGNHPTDIRDYVRTGLRSTFDRLGIEERYTEAAELLLRGVDELMDASPDFTGRHTPSTTTRPIQVFLEDTFVRSKLCSITDAQNYEHALDLIDSGQNVVLTPNHTSPVDGLIPIKLFRDNFKGAEPPALVMSQVFEYARITRLFTSGLKKYPVFQPKHMGRFAEAGREDVAHRMQGQNVTTMRALHSDTKQGGQNIFLYLERDRNTDGMGVPEPTAMRVIEMMERAKRGVHIVPIHITGAETILPNRPGVNEVDLLMDTIQIGQGDVVCGKPILFSDVLEATESVDQRELVRSTIGDDEYTLQDPKRRRLATAAIAILSLVADLSPSEAAKGVYQNTDMRVIS